MRIAWSARRSAAAAVLPAAAMALVTACSSPAPPATSAIVAASAAATAQVPAGGSSSAAAPASASRAAASAPSSCSVVTAAEAGQALGQPVRPPVIGKATVEGGAACVFYGPAVPPGTSPDIPVGDSVRVVLVTGPKAKRYFDDYRSKVNAQPVAGLGDQAFYDGYASLSVLKGDAYVRIAVGTASNLAAEKVLAADAVPRM